MKLAVSKRPVCGRPEGRQDERLYLTMKPDGYFHHVLRSVNGEENRASAIGLDLFPQTLEELALCGLVTKQLPPTLTRAGVAALSILDGGVEFQADRGIRK